MDIRLKANYFYELIFECENIKVSDDIEERIYQKKDDRSFDFSKPPERDIKDGAIEQFSSVLQDMIHYRKKDFDSSDLIEVLFDKIPSVKINTLLDKLEKRHRVDEETTTP